MATIFAPQDSTNMSQATWQEMFNGMHTTGVLAAQLNVYVTTVTTFLGISVASGKALIQGFLARSDAAVALTCAAADPTNPRIDRAVLHADLSAHTLSVILLTGTPAGSPVPPTLTQTATVWEISLYQVRVNATQTVLSAGSLTDERGYSTPTGAPALIARVPRTVVTVTSLQTLLIFSIPANGTYRLSGQLRIGNGTAANKPIFKGTFIGATGATDTFTHFAPDNSGPPAVAHYLDGTGATYGINFGVVDIPSQTYQMNVGNLTVTYQTNGTPNDVVSMQVERLD